MAYGNVGGGAFDDGLERLSNSFGFKMQSSMEVGICAEDAR